MTAPAAPGLTFDCCPRCGDSYCEPCGACGACSATRCGCVPPASTAYGHEGSCESCGRAVHLGDQVRVYEDAVVHDSCPTERAQA